MSFALYPDPPVRALSVPAGARCSPCSLSAPGMSTSSIRPIRR